MSIKLSTIVIKAFSHRTKETYFFDVCRLGVNSTGKNTGDSLVFDIGFAMVIFSFGVNKPLRL